MFGLEVVYSSFFQFWLIFLNPSYQSHSKEYHFNWCWHRTPPLKKKRLSIFENLHLEQQRRSSAAWRYRWLACVLLQVVWTSPSGSRPPQFFPSLPTPRTGLLIPSRNSSTASAEEFYYSFYYNEELENKLTRALLLGVAKSINYDFFAV